jgi:hypothetical protein
MTPGVPIHHFDLGDYDAERCAEWMLRIVDESPDRLAILEVPPHRDDDDLDRLEGQFIAAYDVAKDARPDLSVKLLRSMDVHNGRPRDRIIVAVHEHRWVGGVCVHGCPDTRPVDGEHRSE